MRKALKWLQLLAALPVVLSRPTKLLSRQSQNRPQLTQAEVNITTYIEAQAISQFRATLIRKGLTEGMRTDDIGMCGGIADVNGGFTHSQVFNVISEDSPFELTQMMVPSPVSQGEGYASMYWDLCSDEETRGVIPQARFECQFNYYISQFSDGSVPRLDKRIKLAYNGFQPDAFNRSWTDGSDVTSVRCGRRTNGPISYTGQQPKSSDEAVYQFVINGTSLLKDVDLCGALPAEGDGEDDVAVRYDYNSTRRFLQGQTFRLPSVADGQGEAVLYYGDCTNLGTKGQATHKCTFKYTANQKQGEAYPFASQLLQINSAQDVQLSEVEGQESVDIEQGSCEQLEKPAEADERPTQSSQTPPRQEAE